MAAGLCFPKVQLSASKKSFLRIFSRYDRYNLCGKIRQSSSNNEFSTKEEKVLYINSSGADNRSFTGETARLFLEKYTALHPDHSIEEVNLWSRNLLKYSLSHVESRLRIADGDELPDDRSRYLPVQEMAHHFLSGNKFIISCPMWNFSVPYILKQYIDCIVQSELTFRETEAGIEAVEGLVVGRPLLLITSSADDFSEEPLKKLDFQVPYLKAIFGFIGFRDFRHIYIANTKHQSREALLECARQRIEDEVVRF